MRRDRQYDQLGYYHRGGCSGVDVEPILAESLVLAVRILS